MNCFVNKSLTLVALIAAFAMAQSDTAVGQLGFFSGIEAVVDLSTGEIIIEIVGDDIQVIGIGAGGSAIFDTAAFDPASGLGPAGQLDPVAIGFLALAPFPEGTFNLGPILAEPFRTLEAIEDLSLRGARAGGSVATNITVINSIPEPGSLSLLALASLTVVVRRRR